jgi:hypothetical protein
MIMTAVSDGTAAGQAAVPSGPQPPQDDVMVLAGDQLSPEGLWLLVTGVDAIPDGAFTGIRLPAEGPRASGGDVVLRLAAGPGRLPGSADEPQHVQVYTVMAGTLVLVAEWGIADWSDWSEVVRMTTAFTMGAVTELEERGADLHSHEAVDLEPTAAMFGLPTLAGTSTHPRA